MPRSFFPRHALATLSLLVLSAASSMAVPNPALADTALENPPRSSHSNESATPFVKTHDIRVSQVNDTTGSLRDAWLREPEQPPAPGYAFMLRKQDVDQQQFSTRRLLAELEALKVTPAFLDHATVLQAAGLEAWHAQLDAYAGARLSRTPGRADPASLVARPRHNPAAATLAHFGHCQPPTWVEVWHAHGVSRLPHQPGMTLSDALEEVKDGLPDLSIAPDTAWRVSPLGRVNSIGIAAFNHQRVELTPGSRIVLPLPPVSIGARWINRSLPRFLATRLPGNDCMLYSLTSLAPAKGPAAP